MGNNIFVKFLVENGWEERDSMSYVNISTIDYEVFFDTSNQVELYYKNERIAKAYLIEIEDIERFLFENVK